MRRIAVLLLAGIASFPVAAQDQSFFRMGLSGGEALAGVPGGEDASVTFTYPNRFGEVDESYDSGVPVPSSGSIPPGTTFAIAPGSALLTGLTLNPTTGAITGTPDSQHGQSDVSVLVMRPGKPVLQVDFTMVVTGPFTVDPVRTVYDLQLGTPEDQPEIIFVNSVGMWELDGVYEQWAIENSTVPWMPNGPVYSGQANKIQIPMPVPPSGTAPGDYQLKISKVSPDGTKGYSGKISVTVYPAPFYEFAAGTGPGYEVVLQGNGRPLIRILQGASVDVPGIARNSAEQSEAEYETYYPEAVLPPQAPRPEGIEITGAGSIAGTATGPLGTYPGVVVMAYSGSLGGFGHTMVDIEIVDAL